jgi:hypothetical protein
MLPFHIMSVIVVALQVDGAKELSAPGSEEAVAADELRKVILEQFADGDGGANGASSTGSAS